MAGQSSGQTPRTSTSSRPSASSSLDTYDRLIVNGDDELQLGEGQVNGSDAAKEAGDEHLSRRHRPRSSGGFLLPATPATVLHPLTNPEPEISEKGRGKRKVEEGDLIVPKRASLRHRHRQKPSLGSSPLATEISNAQSSEERDGNNNLAKKHTSMLRSNPDSKHAPATSAASSEHVDHLKRGSAIGIDTDPAQIVNLALNLSESRRRHFSSSSHLVPRESIGARRLGSSGQPTSGLPISPGGGNLRQHLQQQRQISRNVSPRSGRSVSSKGPGSPIPRKELPAGRKTSNLPDFDVPQIGDTSIDASDATLARVEKARISLELSYEYRRLLQYLPKLRAPHKDTLNTSKGIAKYQAPPDEALGRTYNPLQYIRNRKVRFSEKRPLDCEGQGWNDIDAVRSWIDRLAKVREYDLSRVDRRFPLPPFDTSQHGLAISDGTQAASNQARKISRPHTVWEFSAWDLLADAYWLHQDDNVLHIEDARGNKIFKHGQSDHEDGPDPSKVFAKDPVRRSESIVRLNRSPERLRASFESFRSDSKERGRRLLERKEPRSPVSDDNGSQTRKSRWPRRFVRSRSPSSSGESHGAKRRGHKRGRDKLGSRDDYDHAALEKHMMEILAREAEGDDKPFEKINDLAAKEAHAESESVDGKLTNGQISRAAERRPSAPQRLKTDMAPAIKHKVAARASLDEKRFAHHRMSSDDFDSTAPNSPTASGFVPSIAINLSPPASPPTSAPSSRKPLPARLSTFRKARSPSIRKRAGSENDLEAESVTSAEISRQTTNDSQAVNALRKERSTPVTNELLSPKKTGSSKGSIRSLKEGNAPDSRFRGLFKGGRIAELVGSEVSRVGDMLWRKDTTSYPLQTISPVASSFASEESDLDDGDVSSLEDSPNDKLSRSKSHTDHADRPSPTLTNGEQPKYHMSNLPSFQSSMNRNKESPKTTDASPNHDHITRQQLALRERGRSTRFDRLAPPKIDMRGISPSPSRSRSPEHAEARPTHDAGSRNSSSSRSGRRVHSADRRLNAMLNIPGKVGTGGPAPTGLSRLAARQQGSRERPTLADKRQWSISDRGVSAVRGTITKRDIARVRALLLSSGVKANEIVRRAEETPEKPSPFLQNLADIFESGVPHLPRSQEYIAAGRMLVSKIEATTQQLKDTADQFAHSTVDKLHHQIKDVDDRVNYKLTPLVRAAADDADAFSTELTTTHTLAVKQLNDSMDVILRRRRRRLRWVRRWGWAMLEWTLLGVMWVVWFIVMIIQLMRGIVAGFIRGIRWLFWL